MTKQYLCFTDTWHIVVMSFAGVHSKNTLLSVLCKCCVGLTTVCVELCTDGAVMCIMNSSGHHIKWETEREAVGKSGHFQSRAACNFLLMMNNMPAWYDLILSLSLILNMTKICTRQLYINDSCWWNVTLFKPNMPYSKDRHCIKWPYDKIVCELIMVIVNITVMLAKKQRGNSKQIS